jgi:peptidoglycan/xylan/chitin deacetylase (PgdA/CDA1 family)
VVATGVELSLDELPALWSPDSRFFVYARGSTLYYFALAQLAEGRVLAEELRRVGDGRTANVRWSAAGTLYYLDGSIVYAIEPGELFTRALYAGFLPIGRVAGKIPFAFDPSFDRFHVSPDGRSVLLDKGGRNLFLYRLAAGDFRATGNPVALPYLYLPRNTTVRRVVWSRANVITILCSAQSGGKAVTTVFRLVPDASGSFGPFVPAPETGVRELVLSPNEAMVALVTADAVSWKDYASWKDRGRAGQVSPLAVLWIADNELLVAGAWTIERLRTDTGAAKLVALSQVERGSHAAGAVAVQAQGKAWTFEETSGAWKTASAYSPAAPTTASASWRVYLEPSTRGSYRNRVMVRDAQGFGTEPLFAAEPQMSEAFPAEDEPVDFGNVTHGSRIRRREVALVFNAMESDEGLTRILETLAAYGITGTFFVNGEFIRRYPDAVREIADSGHEVGSAFYRAFHMVDARFSVDRSFVQEGLAANEDEYFAATGRELALLWHAPGYLVSSDIIAAGAAMNYTYVGRDLDTKDWVSEADAGSAPGIYQSATDLVERVVAAKRPGSIVPILVGPGGGSRGDYLFQKLDLLVNELGRLGYDIVPVSALIEHAR